MQYLFWTRFVFAKRCISDFFCGFWTDLLSIQEEMFYNSFLTSTISPSVRISIKNGVFCIFHMIFTGFSLSWTRRVLRQARIRDVKYYTNCELSPVLKGVFPQATGYALESPPSLEKQLLLRWYCICSSFISTTRDMKTNAGWEGKRAANLLDIQYNKSPNKNQFE